MDRRHNAFLNLVLGLIVAALVVYIVCDKVSAINKAEGALAEKIETHDRGADFMVVHDLYAYSDEQLGNSVSITGVYSNSLVQEDGSVKKPEGEEPVYHFLTVFDTAGDCFFTIEFISLSGEYPEVGDLIYASGTFTKYTEDGMEYVTISDADWSLLESGNSLGAESGKTDSSRGTVEYQTVNRDAENTESELTE